jgi:hypothetical protein
VWETQEKNIKKLPREIPIWEVQVLTFKVFQIFWSNLFQIELVFRPLEKLQKNYNRMDCIIKIKVCDMN